jgi:hypothetical protein
MTGPHIVYGQFRGLFKTKQSGVLPESESPPHETSHAVQVYQGNFDAEQFFEEFKPHEYRKLKSFVLSNVPNVKLTAPQVQGFVGGHDFTFTQLILIDPKIIRTYEIEGETYGEIASKAYGKTFTEPQLKKLKPDPFNDTGYSDHEQWYRTNNGCWNSGVNGCGTMYQGCKTNFWKILGLLLLLLLLLGLIRACNHIANDKQACVDADLARKERIQKEKEVKETKLQYDLNLKNALANVSTIYFYRNSTDIHINSTGMNGTIDRLSEVIQAYDDKSFVLEGHQDDKSIESTGLDIKRAEKIKHVLTLKGIDEQRITVVGRQNKDATPMPLYKFMDDMGTREYNQNMKVTVRVRKQ